MSTARPSRRRGRLTEQQEAAAQELRQLREGGGRRTDAVEVSVMWRYAAAPQTVSLFLLPAPSPLTPPPTFLRNSSFGSRMMSSKISTRRWTNASTSRARLATGRRHRISSKTTVNARSYAPAPTTTAGHRGGSPRRVHHGGPLCTDPEPLRSGVTKTLATCAEGIGYLNEEEEEDLEEETSHGAKRGRAGRCSLLCVREGWVQLFEGFCAGSGGGKDSKKQKTGDSSLPQSMLSSFLRKG